MKLNEIKNGNMNEVYWIKIGKRKYIIRTSDFDNSFEYNMLKYLEKSNFPCPRVVTNFQLENKNIMIYPYIVGKNPDKFDSNFFINLAQLMRVLHNMNHHFKRENYIENEENQDKLYQYYTKAIRSKYLKNDLELITELYKQISQLDLDQFEKCIIHSDIKKENIIQNGNELYLIDFGNCYIGNRLIDVIRVIMWFFIKENQYSDNNLQKFIYSYFKNDKLKPKETKNIYLLILFCVFYNLMKDIALYEEQILSSEYIENNSLKWLEALKNKDKFLEIEELIKNACRLTK